MVSVCIVNGVFPPHVNGGAENYVLRVAKALQNRGHTVSILTTKPYTELADLQLEKSTYEGVPVYRFYPFNHSHRATGTGNNVITKAVWHQLDTINPHAKKMAERVLEEVQPDVVHTNNFMGISTAIGSAIEESGSRYVHMLHDYSLMCPKSNLLRDRTLPDDQLGVCREPPVPCRLYARAKERTIGSPDLVIAPSQHVIDVHREHGLFTDISTERIRHGVTAVADESPDRNGNRSILYAGKLQRSKGLETLLSAAKKATDVEIDICGSGPLDEEIERTASEVETLHYHGFVSSERLRELRYRAAAGVVPSIWMENSPLVIYESFAQGLPVIGTDIGGIPELVEHDVRGMLFPVDDVDELREAIRFVVTPENNRRMSDNALEWANTHTMGHHVDRLLEHYEISGGV